MGEKRHQRGQVMILFALMSGLLFGVAAAGFDLSAAMADRRNLQAYADDAAIAAGYEYRSPNVSTNLVHWIAMNYLHGPLNFTLPQGSCTSSSACPAGTYTIGGYTVTMADPAANRLDLSVTRTEPGIFRTLIGAGPVKAGSSARATGPTYTAPCGMCVLASGSVPNAFDLKANGGVTINGAGFQTNSTDPSTAAITEGNGGLTVSAPYTIGIAPGGGWTKGGSGGFSPTPVSKPPVPDPLSSVTLPTTPAACSAGPSGGAVSPGCYTSLSANTSALTLGAGTYIITGTLDLGGYGVSGTGVTLYFACSSWPDPCASGAAGGSIMGSSNGNLNISAPLANSGQPYPGMAIFYDRNNTSTLLLSGDGAATITGTLYAASALLNSQGNGGYTINGLIIVKTALMEANGALSITYDPNQNYTPAGGSGLTR